MKAISVFILFGLMSFYAFAEDRRVSASKTCEIEDGVPEFAMIVICEDDAMTDARERCRDLNGRVNDDFGAECTSNRRNEKSPSGVKSYIDSRCLVECLDIN